MEIREAVDADADTIWTMLEPVFRAGTTYAIDPGIPRDRALAYWMGQRSYVAHADGKPLGTFYIHENRPGGGSHYCNCGFVTARGSEGRGVARQMLEAALAEARALGFEAMVFNFVVASNTRALDLWCRYGFEQVGRVPGAFRTGTGEDADALILFRRL